MADNEDSSQKTEEPTQRRLEEAEKKGQIAYSREVNNFFVMLALALIIAWLAPGMMNRTKDALAPFITRPHDFPIAGEPLRQLFESVAGQMGAIVVAPLSIIIILVLGAAFMQSKFLFALERIKPKMEKISPVKGAKRLFSMRSIVEFIKGLIKISVVGIVGYLAVAPRLDELGQLPLMDVLGMLELLSALALRILIGVCCVMFIVAIIDYAYQRFEYIKQLRMSKQEIKDEHKQQEGDPLIKSKLRQIRMERARKRMMAAVPEADVVITNPTHFAVALKYETGLMQAPIVIAKGVDEVAFRIRDVAEEHDIPIVENAPLARALHAGAELDEEIPYEHYKAVAEVIGYVYRLKGKMQ